MLQRIETLGEQAFLRRLLSESASVSLTGCADEEFVATAISYDTSSVDQVSDVYFPLDSSVESCLDMLPC
jgi:hypothetical protein